MNTLRNLLVLSIVAALGAPLWAQQDDQSEAGDAAAAAPVAEIAPAPEAVDEAPAAKPEFDPQATGPDKVPVAPPAEAEALDELHFAPVAMKKVAFLGVATQEADAAATAQLKLPEGVGLSVLHVVPNTPAAEAGVVPGDVLHKLDDQILVNPQQLRTLVRTHKAGEPIELTVLRAGESLRLKTKLVERDVPVDEAADGAIRVAPGANLRLLPQRLEIGPGGIVELGPLDLENIEPGQPVDPDALREQVERQRRELIQRIHQMRRQMQDAPLPGAAGGGGAGGALAARATASTVMNDGEHTIKYSISDGDKHLTIKDKAGAVLFDGPVNTDAQREKIPADLRAKFEKLEKRTNINIRVMPDPFVPAPGPSPPKADDEVVG